VADEDPGVGARQAVGDRTGPVGRAVVDDEERRAGGRRENGRGDRREILGLVVGGQDDPGAGPDGLKGGGHRRASVSRVAYRTETVAYVALMPPDVS
jgi:hypothetical protein